MVLLKLVMGKILLLGYFVDVFLFFFNSFETLFYNQKNDESELPLWPWVKS